MAQNNGTKPVTAPVAVIKINGYASGFMRNVRASETIGRQKVRGIGNLAAQSDEAVTIDGTLSCDFYFLSMARPEARAFIRRDQGKDVLINTLTLNETPTEIHMYRKIAIEKDADGVVIGIKPEGEVIAIIRDFYPTSQNFDITESAISGMNISGDYLTPMYTNS